MQVLFSLQYRAFLDLAQDPRDWLPEEADKGTKIVLMTRRFWKKEARKHVEDDNAYKRADQFGKHLRESERAEGPSSVRGR